mmetsp:Transcript_17107/g.51171  ORF Transcript_17107/g.51171 Transcript_17107/m.51171 type:complete len:204 (+) Transcript_17107:1677-2288(+)
MALHRHERWRVQGEEPGAILCGGGGAVGAVLSSLSSSLLRSHGQCALRQPLHILLVSHQLLERFGGILNVVAKLGGQLRELLSNLIEALLLLSLQSDTTVYEITKLLVHNAALRFREVIPSIVLQGLKPFVQRSALPQPQRQLDTLWLDLLHCLPQLLRVLHCLEVRDRAPDATQTIHYPLDGLDQATPRGFHICLQIIDLSV